MSPKQSDKEFVLYEDYVLYICEERAGDFLMYEPVVPFISLLTCFLSKSHWMLSWLGLGATKCHHRGYFLVKI